MLTHLDPQPDHPLPHGESWVQILPSAPDSSIEPRRVADLYVSGGGAQRFGRDLDKKA